MEQKKVTQEAGDFPHTTPTRHQMAVTFTDALLMELNKETTN